MEFLARDRRTLAPYSVNDGPPPKVRGLTRHGSTLRWRRAPRAASYAVAFSGAGGAASSIVTRRPTAHILAGAKTATVMPVGANGRAGRRTVLRLKRGR